MEGLDKTTEGQDATVQWKKFQPVGLASLWDDGDLRGSLPGGKHVGKWGHLEGEQKGVGEKSHEKHKGNPRVRSALWDERSLWLPKNKAGTHCMVVTL